MINAYVASLFAILLTAGAPFIEWNIRRGDKRPITQHYSLSAIGVAGVISIAGYGQWISGSNMAVYVVGLSALILTAYWLPGSERNDRIARWLFRASLGWALLGLPFAKAAAWVIDRAPSLLGAQAPVWLWLLTIVGTGTGLYVYNRRRDQQSAESEL